MPGAQPDSAKASSTAPSLPPSDASLLPPSSGAEVTRSPESTSGSSPTQQTAESLGGLPPTVTAGSPAQPSGRKVPTGPNVDALLPPGVDGAAPLPGEATSSPLPAGGQVALPTEEDAAEMSPLAGMPKPDGAVMIPTEDGGVVAVRDHGKIIHHDGEEIELRKLTPEEKARRRMIKNAIMATIGISFLAAVALLLMMFGG